MLCLTLVVVASAQQAKSNYKEFSISGDLIDYGKATSEPISSITKLNKKYFNTGFLMQTASGDTIDIISYNKVINDEGITQKMLYNLPAKLTISGRVYEHLGKKYYVGFHIDYK